jgi:hypothetical protein
MPPPTPPPPLAAVDRIASQAVLMARILILSTCLVAPAYAYLDPGTGNALLQGLIGAFAIGAAAVGTFFGRIRSVFRRKPKPPQEPRP